jgi:hypothetical protein
MFYDIVCRRMSGIAGPVAGLRARPPLKTFNVGPCSALLLKEFVGSGSGSADNTDITFGHCIPRVQDGRGTSYTACCD